MLVKNRFSVFKEVQFLLFSLKKHKSMESIVLIIKDVIQGLPALLPRFLIFFFSLFLLRETNKETFGFFIRALKGNLFSTSLVGVATIVVITCILFEYDVANYQTTLDSKAYIRREDCPNGLHDTTNDKLVAREQMELLPKKAAVEASISVGLFLWIVAVIIAVFPSD